MTKVKYTKELLQSAVDDSFSVMEVVRYLGLTPAGGTHAHIKRRIQQYEIDTTHFLGQRSNLGKPSKTKLTDAEHLKFLVEGSPLDNRIKSIRLRKAMIIAGIASKCVCGLTDSYNDKPLVLEIDHINGNHWDNRKENLRFLCPNCHSQQDNGKPWKYK